MSHIRRGSLPDPLDLVTDDQGAVEAESIFLTDDQVQALSREQLLDALGVPKEAQSADQRPNKALRRLVKKAKNGPPAKAKSFRRMEEPDRVAPNYSSPPRAARIDSRVLGGAQDF